MKSVLVTGASGLLGRMLVRELRAAGFDVRGTAFQRAGNGLDRLDLCDGAAVRDYVARVRPWVVVHAAAERKPDVSEKDPAGTLRLNVEATRTIAAAARDAGAWILFFSTDYVFDGSNPPYRPDAATKPLNIYGRSKRDGELAVRETIADHAILRVPILYGPVESLDESPVTVIAGELMRKRGRRVELDHWAMRYPTLTADVAAICRGILEHKLAHPGFRGTFHFSGNEPMTKFEMGRRIARIVGFPEADIVPNSNPTSGAPRPRDCRLDCGDLEALGITRHTAFDKAMPGILATHLDGAL